jgi:GH15 family glucan-1,4-alpha-glucosidase
VSVTGGTSEGAQRWVGETGVGSSPFPPIAEYGFLSDCETCALVAPSGNVEWLCLPRFDSPSVFGAMLDRDAGMFRLGPADVQVPASRRYLPGTMVLETSWGTRGGWIIVRDVLLIGPWHHEHDRSNTHRRAPTDYDADHVLLRTVRCVNGEVQLLVDCEPWFDYGRTPAEWEHTGEGYREAKATAEGVDIELQLVSDMNIGFEGPRATGRTLLKQGDVRFVALAFSEHAPPTTYEDAYDRLVWTAHHWQHWLDHGDFPDHPWRTALQRSALTLKGLSYAPTGALVAAPTTSLPESPGGERNWDYRFSWIRDATFMLWSLYTLGFDWEANDFFYFIADVAESEEGQLQIMYGIDGEEELPERIWPILTKQVESALENWREPDRGIWEVRGDPQHFTSSKLMCWVAADRGARLAEMRDELELAARWQSTADEIKADICENAVDERGVFCQHYDTDALDASVLLIPLVRFLPPDDERVRKTVLTIADELTEQGLVLRYRVEETDDGLHGEEGTFTICSFWLVSALVEIGEVQRARELCEKLLSHASPLGLYAEEIDTRSGRHLGNFPQAFTHLSLINAVMHVIRADQGLETSTLPFGRELARQRSQTA